MQLKVNETFITTDPSLHDSLYVVGGKAENQPKFNKDIMYYIGGAYNHYKPIGIATTGEVYFDVPNKYAIPGVIFATNNTNFGKEYLQAITKQRFWDRKLY